MAPVLLVDECGIHDNDSMEYKMKKNKYACPYCGAPAEFERPFSRYYQFLFWTIKLPSPAWYATCSEYCEGFLASPEYTCGRSLSECRRNWRKWYAAETAGLPDIPILAMTKFGKGAK